MKRLALFFVLVIPFCGWSQEPGVKVETLQEALPLYFIPNVGQVDPQAAYYVKGKGYTLWLTHEGIILDQRTERSIPDRIRQFEKNLFPEEPEIEQSLTRWTFVDSREDLKIVPFDQTIYRVNYFKGQDSSNWYSGIPTYAGVRYKEIYQGIDLVVSGSEDKVKLTWEMSPGADVSNIRWSAGGNEAKIHDGSGLINTLVSQNSISVCALGDNLYGPELVGEDSPTIITMSVSLGYSTYLGGSSGGEADTMGCSIAVDSSGNILVTGNTYSIDFPIHYPYQERKAEALDVFVTKFTPDGQSLVWSTYLGGRGNDGALGIAVDPTGVAIVTGYTCSVDFPLQNPFQNILSGIIDAFVTKFTPDGRSLTWSTYLGGSNSDWSNGIVVDTTGAPIVTGYTASSNFPLQYSYQGYGGGSSDVFVSKFTPDGQSFIWSTYLGGSQSDQAWGIATDNSSNIYVTGDTYSTDFPLQNPYQGSSGGFQDAFVTKIAPDGQSLVWSTYLGGSGSDISNDIALDASDAPVVTGSTSSTDFPLQNPFQNSNQGIDDAFITKFTPDGQSLTWSTYLGGSDYDYGSNIALDTTDAPIVSGITRSVDFPLQNPYQVSYGGGGNDVFVLKFAPDGQSLAWSSYLGGSGWEWCNGIAVDGTGASIVTGGTWSTDFPLQNPYQGILYGYQDAYITKFSPQGDSLAFSTYLGGTGGGDMGEKIAMDTNGAPVILGVTESTDFPLQSPYQGNYGGWDSIFITKFSPDGQSLAWSTYIGGSGFEYPTGIALDASNAPIIVGSTNSTDFPLHNPYQGSIIGNNDAFITRLTSDGQALVWSTFLGGSNYDYLTGIALDTAGAPIVIGGTNSADFPLNNPYQGNIVGNGDAFISKFTPDGQSLTWSTYLGGSDLDTCNGIVVDTTNAPIVTGFTMSADFPLQNPYQGSIAGLVDAFIARFTPNGQVLAWSTYLGGSDYDYPNDIALDTTGAAIVTGYTSSVDFPLLNPHQGYGGGEYDAFVSKFTPDGQSLTWSTYLGGSNFDWSNGIVVDTTGAPIVTGYTTSTDFPLHSSYQGYGGGYSDAFVSKFTPDGQSFAWSTFLGGSQSDQAWDVVTDGLSNVYVTGGTYSIDFSTIDAYQGNSAGDWDAFLVKLIEITCLLDLGDVNGNGLITALDASLVLQDVVGLITLTPEEICRADVNENGQVTSLDAAYILMCVVGNCPGLSNPNFQASCQNHGNCL